MATEVVFTTPFVSCSHQRLGGQQLAQGGHGWRVQRVPGVSVRAEVRAHHALLLQQHGRGQQGTGGCAVHDGGDCQRLLQRRVRSGVHQHVGS
ncbi:hypothetical protein PHYSODRAFT_285723 [Phytophthora sojae]|uniref:Uncharacterized protein n=1 Tax=Phytophthora sojae (strain P6497) TaxID=1094619 RepID=G4Z6D4_PHYSP|nr:hypothetical protein PHYSODRAFT_285723 [Phytophthora sojae]EGZ22384.1 hypothetical protein PHYSODRAFT_285723 [Phytophthora sojae]|eukprot:XP_009525101.1 hypothetical protein PHYSODRAFT_285723 [Phytophthora sojae]